MAVAARIRAGHLQHRGQVPVKTVLPEAEAAEEEVGAPELEVGREEVVPEIDRAPGQAGRLDQRLEAPLRLFARHHVGEQRQALGMLAERRLRRIRREQGAVFAPELALDRGGQARGAHPPVVGERRVADSRLGFGRRPHRMQVLEVDLGVRTVAVGVRRHAGVDAGIDPAGHPVHEVPAGRTAQKPRLVRIGVQPQKRMVHAGHPRLQPRAVRVVARIVAEHHDLDAGKAEGVLRAARGTVHGDSAVLAAIRVKERQRIPHQPVFRVEEARHEALDPRVARIHLLLVVGAVEEHVVLAHLQRTRADGLETVQKRVVRRERGLQLGRIAHFGDLDALDGQRLVRRPERQAAPRACAPPRRREARVRAPVAAEDVPERTRDVESLAGGAVTLVALRVRQALRPVPADLRPLPA